MDYSEALKYIQESGYKLTNKRKEMIRIFFNHDYIFSAKIIFDFMKVHYPAISIDTIYRNLNLFKQLSLIHHTEFQKQTYYYRNRMENSFYGHIICMKCRSIKSVVMNSSRTLVPYLCFSVSSYKFEIYGRCTKC
ncbi:Fur family transcriptional regulator [Marinococcus sp. PL1-022]|uniref:Fur family transcriptional regulator n=1 Tax=Marinococcus sp. PL1-022 TaxID=3095363 RepID=UPI0039B61C9D